MTDFVTLYMTAPNADEAMFIAKVVISEKLAACVNLIDGVTSVYRWEGNVEEETEVCALFKTSQDQIEKLTSRIKELHSYECPCIVVWPIIDGDDDYLTWLGAATRSKS